MCCKLLILLHFCLVVVFYWLIWSLNPDNQKRPHKFAWPFPVPSVKNQNQNLQLIFDYSLLLDWLIGVQRYRHLRILHK